MVDLLVLWMIAFSLISPLVYGYGVFKHKEFKSSHAIPEMRGGVNYIDGTVVIRVAFQDDCYQKLSLRIIYPNGTVGVIDNDVEDIQDFNWCYEEGNPYSDSIEIYALRKGYVLVRYFVKNLNDSNKLVFEEWGLIIGWDGIIHG